jgi:hypothetical protein
MTVFANSAIICLNVPTRVTLLNTAGGEFSIEPGDYVAVRNGNVHVGEYDLYNSAGNCVPQGQTIATIVLTVLQNGNVQAS